MHTHCSWPCPNPQPAVAVASPISLKCRALGKLVSVCVRVECGGVGGGLGGQVAATHAGNPNSPDSLEMDPIPPEVERAPDLKDS